MSLNHQGDLTSLTYVSEEIEPLSEMDVINILESSRRRNQASGITGLLVYVRGHFLQVLEGPDAAVQATMQRIRADCRHFRIRVVLTLEIPERHFGLWSMAFPTVDELSEELLRKYSFINPEKPFPQVGRRRVLEFLSAFQSARTLPS